ncbi:hypothetical protein J2Z79_002600 [Symbiobacterium terraclitae]|jgi:hypothetical protein|uniref:TadE-like domain-containing protein n=1 Tax=Symbiobacterium terraclitae TaxID=557451 RepID=A0ABS4JUI0_9FIRM|nr:TadE/TadG family type IV pilus assembly protein [Symbiobacterium terraclitae]MBP2019183.1 hypothetical protein [Symbiobacterium terraclitae]
MKRLQSEQRGGIAVEAALTLPLILLLTLGGASVLLWLHHKTWLQVLVAETARERAADATWTGYYKDVRDTLSGPDSGLVLVEARLVSFHLPTDPPFVMAGACAAPAGYVPSLPVRADGGESGPPRPAGGGWLQPVWELRWQLTRWLQRAERVADRLEEYADEGVVLGEQLVWYRRVADNLLRGTPFQRRQAVDYLAGGALEEAMRIPCRGDGPGDAVLAAKAVIQGERAFGQR